MDDSCQTGLVTFNVLRRNPLWKSCYRAHLTSTQRMWNCGARTGVWFPLTVPRLSTSSPIRSVSGQLDWLVYNAPLDYAKLVLSGELGGVSRLGIWFAQRYLRTVCETRRGERFNLNRSPFLFLFLLLALTVRLARTVLSPPAGLTDLQFFGFLQNPNQGNKFLLGDSIIVNTQSCKVSSGLFLLRTSLEAHGSLQIIR